MESTQKTSAVIAKKPKGCLNILLASIITSAVLVALFFLWSKSWTWDQLNNVPENAAEVVSYDEPFTLFIETSDQKYHSCEIKYKDLKCKEITKDLISEHPDLCDGAKLLLPRPPGKTISRNTFHLCGPDVKIHLNYAILEDGTLWEHWDGSSWGDAFIIPFIIIIGATLGSIIGLIFTRRKKSLEDKTSNSPEA